MKYYYASERDPKTNKWLLVDIQTGQSLVVTGDQVKQEMKNNNVDVVNLKLTSDNRLISASEDIMKAALDFKNAPEDVKKVAKPIKDRKYIDFVNDRVDKMMKAAAKSLEYTSTVGKHKQFVKIQTIDAENNIIGLIFTKGTDTRVVIRYEIPVYGMLKKHDTYGKGMLASDIDWTEIYYDVLIQVLGVSRGKEVYKTDKSIISIAKKDLIPNEFQYLHFQEQSGSTREDIDRGDYLALMVEESDGKLLDEQSNKEYKTFMNGTLLSALAYAMIESGIEANKVNNVDVQNLMRYEKANKEIFVNRMLSSAVPIGVAAATALIIGGASLLHSYLPDNFTLQFGLAQALGYKSIAEFVTATGIAPIKAAVAGGTAGVLGGGITKVGMGPAKAGIKSAKNWKNNIKNDLNDTSHNLDNRFGGEKNGWDKDGRSYHIESDWIE